MPKELDRLILRCLRKEPERRFQHMVDVKLELEQIKEESDSGRARGAAPARRKRLPWLDRGRARRGSWPWPRRRELLATVPRRPARPPTAGAAPHVDARQRGGRLALAGRRAGGVHLERREAGQLRHLPQDGRVVGGPPPHDGSRAGHRSELVSRRPPDRVPFVTVPTAMQIHLVSPLGGSDRKLGDFPLAYGPPSWSPDGRWLAVARAPVPAPGVSTGRARVRRALPRSGGGRRASRPPASRRRPATPSTPASLRTDATWPMCPCVGFSCHVDVVELGADFVAEGTAPAPHATADLRGRGLSPGPATGSPCSSSSEGIHRLWRVAIAGDRAPGSRSSSPAWAAIRPTVRRLP